MHALAKAITGMPAFTVTVDNKFRWQAEYVENNETDGYVETTSVIYRKPFEKESGKQKGQLIGNVEFEVKRKSKKPVYKANLHIFINKG